MEVGKGYASRGCCLKRRGVGKTQTGNGRAKTVSASFQKKNLNLHIKLSPFKTHHYIYSTDTVGGWVLP